MTQFKVGDLVEIIYREETEFDNVKIGQRFLIERLPFKESSLTGVYDKDGRYFLKKQIRKIGESMSQYDSLKQRIEALNNGWTKEADDILREMKFHREGKNTNYVLAISDHQIYVYQDWCYTLDTNTNYKACFDYISQCEKNKAFKKALLWLLDNSDIEKDEKSEKIAEFQKELDTLKEKREELERKIKDVL